MINHDKEITISEKNKAIDDFVEIFKNPLTIDALIKAKDNPTICAIIKAQAEQLKEKKNDD